MGVRARPRSAREYLAGRGLGEEVLREFRVGYAPSAWDRVLLASRRGGFSEQELYATGLAQRSKENGRPYDRFRSRIMFPLADIRGRVLGFGARAMREEQRPKYLNTSDNDVYHKGLHLYGADLARAHAARAGQVILCEGYTDVIALHQAGMRNAVGLMGTALTAEQVGELARMAQTVLLALDADSAGQEAMLRASALAAKRKLELRVVPLPAGHRPGRADPARRRRGDERGGRAVGAVRALSRRARARGGDDSSPEGRDRMIDELRPVFATLPPSAMRMELTRIVSSRLALPESLAETAARRGRARGRARSAAAGRGGARRGRRRGARAAATAPARAAPAALSRPRGHRAGVPRAVHRLARGGRAGARRPGRRRALLQRAAAPRGAAPARGRSARADGATRRRRGALEEDPELKALLAELVVEAGREQPTRRCSRCSACSSSSRASSARSSRRAGRTAATSATWRSAGPRSSSSSTGRTAGCSRRPATGS